ncbi:MAG: hypothetical protein E7389_02720 [Ruminococcaceae bacterium]|nr:hypothetical protein [Oscillospiraceae bacterium]
MTIKEELIRRSVAESVAQNLRITEYDINTVADTAAINALDEIKSVISRHEELSDFYIVDEIVEIFIKYGIDTNGCHDFG